MFRIAVVVWSLALFLTWCGECQAVTPPSLSDVSYGPDPQQVIDVWLPPSSKRTPLVVVFHGGGFVRGDKRPPGEVVSKFLDADMAVIRANYRLAPRVIYPTPMLDGARVIQWARAHSAEYNIDPNRIAVMGFSAGGTIALWLAFHADLADQKARDPIARESTAVAAVVTVNAQSTYDPQTIANEFHSKRLPLFLAKFFGARSPDELTDARFSQAERQASPASYIHRNEPPALLYYAHRRDAKPNADSLPTAYIHSSVQGDYLDRIAQSNGARVIVRTEREYPTGLPGFLVSAADFLKTSFRN